MFVIGRSGLGPTRKFNFFKQIAKFFKTRILKDHGYIIKSTWLALWERSRIAGLIDYLYGDNLSLSPKQLCAMLSDERVLCQHDSASKKSLLTTISQLFHHSVPTLEQTTLFDAYVARERLGSTALGHGVSIPHVRIESISKPLGCLLQLRRGIDFGAEDKQPVDLIFALLVPSHHTQEHLTLLAQLAHCFSQPTTRQHLRDARTSQQLLQRFINSHASKHALSA